MQRVVEELLKRGWWRHFKGGRYFVVSVRPMEADEFPDVTDAAWRQVVRYRPWGGNEPWDRPLSEFLGWIEGHEETGYTGWRFWPEPEFGEPPLPEEVRPAKEPA